MRITEIIAEAGPTSYMPASPTSPIVVPTPLTPTPSPRPSSPRSAPSSSSNPIKDANKAIQKYSDSLIKRIKNAPRKAEAAERYWKGNYGTALTWFMRLIGIAEALTDLYAELDLAQNDYDKGDISQDTLERHREWAFGVFTIQVATPAVVKLVASTLRITMVVRWIKNAVGVLGAGASLGATAAAAIASEAFFIWLQSWLTGPEGKAWLTNSFIMPIVRSVGVIPEGLWSKLVGYYDKGGSGDKAKDKVKPAEPSKPEDKPNSGQGGQPDDSGGPDPFAKTKRQNPDAYKPGATSNFSKDMPFTKR